MIEGSARRAGIHGVPSIIVVKRTSPLEEDECCSRATFVVKGLLFFCTESVGLRVRVSIMLVLGSVSGDNSTADTLPFGCVVHWAADRGRNVLEEAGEGDNDQDGADADDAVVTGPEGEDGGARTTRSVSRGVKDSCEESFVSEYEGVRE